MINLKLMLTIEIRKIIVKIMIIIILIIKKIIIGTIYNNNL